MDINAEKLELMQKLLQVEDEKTLYRVKKALQSDSKFDLSVEQENFLLDELKASDADIKANKVFSQDEVESIFELKRKKA